MAKEALYVSEERLAEVISVIRAGLEVSPDISEETAHNLSAWCEEEDEYLQRLQEDDE